MSIGGPIPGPVQRCSDGGGGGRDGRSPSRWAANDNRDAFVAAILRGALPVGFRLAVTLILAMTSYLLRENN